MRKKIIKLDGADARYGWEFGVDGFVSAYEAAKILGKSHSRVCAWLNDEDRKNLGHPGYPIRGGRPEHAGPTTPWSVCRRSLVEYQNLRQPVEV